MKSSKYEILLTRGRQDVLDEDKYSLLCTELYTLPDHINKLANVQISRDEIPAQSRVMHAFTQRKANPNYPTLKFVSHNKIKTLLALNATID